MAIEKISNETDVIIKFVDFNKSFQRKCGGL